MFTRIGCVEADTTILAPTIRARFQAAFAKRGGQGTITARRIGKKVAADHVIAEFEVRLVCADGQAVRDAQLFDWTIEDFGKR